MQRRFAEIWRIRNEKVGEEKEKRERETGWSKRRKRKEKNNIYIFLK